MLIPLPKRMSPSLTSNHTPSRSSQPRQVSLLEPPPHTCAAFTMPITLSPAGLL